MNEYPPGNVVWHSAQVTPEARHRLNAHRALVLWFTGLSGAGKSTLAHALEAALHAQGRRTFVLDGDNVRHGLCSDLGFSPAERRENMRRIGEMSRLFIDAGVITLAAFISPLHADRALVRQLVGAENFLEVYVQCPLDICENRDVKGMYRRARAGEIAEFTGISAPYEAPLAPELRLQTDQNSLAECLQQLLDFLSPRLQLDPASPSCWPGDRK